LKIEPHILKMLSGFKLVLRNVIIPKCPSSIEDDWTSEKAGFLRQLMWYFSCRVSEAERTQQCLTHKLQLKSQIVNLRFLDNGFALLLLILLDFKLDIKVMGMINYVPCQNL